VAPPVDTLAVAGPPADVPVDPLAVHDPATGPSAEPAHESTHEPAADPAAEATTEPTAEPPASSPPVMGDFRMALVASVSVDLPNQHPAVVLRESESPRRQLTFSIAFHDAVVLSHALRRISTPRPLTHELLTGILQRFDIDVVAVRLVGRQGSVYFAELDLMGRNGRSVQSCRPSDGLTVALLQPVPVPILIDRRLFEQAGDVTPAGAPTTPG
jgi:bifunctional DNase/RNase